MLKHPITVIVHTTVGGPDGNKLIPGQVYELDDSEYVRLLIKSATVSLVDPPSLDPEFLEKNGYELCEGYSYDSLPTQEPEPEPEPVKEPEKPYIMKNAKKAEKVSEEPESQNTTPPETTPEVESPIEVPTEASDHEPKNRQLTPPVKMGVTESVEEE